MKNNVKSNVKRYVISRGNWYLTEKKTYGSLSSSVAFPSESEAREFLYKNSLELKDHSIEDMLMLMTSAKSEV